MMRIIKRVMAEWRLMNDRDIDVISDYLACALPIEELAAVDERLERDVAFRNKVMPIIKAWNMPVVHGARYATGEIVAVRRPALVWFDAMDFLPSPTAILAVVGVFAVAAGTMKLAEVRSVARAAMEEELEHRATTVGLNNKVAVEARGIGESVVWLGGSIVSVTSGSRFTYDKKGGEWPTWLAALDGKASITIPDTSAAIRITVAGGIIELAAGGEYEITTWIPYDRAEVIVRGRGTASIATRPKGTTVLYAPPTWVAVPSGARGLIADGKAAVDTTARGGR